MTKKLLLTFSGLLFGSMLFAQSIPNFIPTKLTEVKCKTDQSHHDLYDSDPIYRANFDNAQLQVRSILNSGIRGGGVYTIPVVVHVMHLGSAEGTNENISDAQIQSAIDNLNDAYANIGYAGLDIQIQFTLAVRDPNCQPTDGINRIDASSFTFGGDAYSAKGATDINRTELKALSNWSNSDFYNIWIVTEIDNNGGGSGTQGYAYFPGAPNGTDGSVILYNAFGYDPTLSLGYNLKSYTNYNTTAIHELGHALDLYHTFEGDDADDDGTPDTCPPTAAGSGDECGDTHAHRRDDSDCQGGIDPTCNGVAGSTVFNNFMAYSSDVCQNRFTTDQKSRMRAAMEGPRASLLNSIGDEPISGSEPGVAQSCQPQTTTLPNGFGIGIFEFALGDLIAFSGDSDDDNGYLEKWCNNTTLDVNTLYSVSVTNRIGGNTEDVKVYIDYNNDGDFLDANEEIFSSNANTFHSGNFTTPASPTTDTPIWVRVISDFSGNTISGPCYTPQYGQVEDYSITISSGAPTTPVAQFSANSTSVCSGSSITFTSSSTDATSYSWDFGTNASPATATGVGPHSVTYTGTGTSTVTLDVTGPGGSDNETKTNYITRNSLVTPSVSISASANPITSGDPVTFTATPTNGGTPSYQWKLNGGNVGSNSTTYNNSSLANGNQVSCVMTSTANCASPSTATSNIITMTVNPGGSCSTDIAGPGGVGNQNDNEIWLDAKYLNQTNDTYVPNWTDRSGNNRNAIQNGTTSQPRYYTNQVNGLPAIKFDGASDFMDVIGNNDLNGSSLTYFIVGANNHASTETVTGTFISGEYNNGVTNGWKVIRSTGNAFVSMVRKADNSFATVNNGTADANVFHSFSNTINLSTDVLNSYKDGNLIGTNGTVTSTFTSMNSIRIGAIRNSTGGHTNILKGKIAEVAVYSRVLNAAELQLVHNYLGAKYNLNLAGNDIYAYQATHKYDAAGIGMTSGVSSTSGRGNIVEMNSASSLANDDFIMFAHNNATTNPTTTGTPSGYSGTGEMMTRVWRADKTNDVGTVTVNFYLDGIATGGSTDFELLKDADGNFSNATRITSGFSYDSNCDVATWTGVNFTDGDFFTIGNPDGAALLVAPIIEMEANMDDLENDQMEAATLEIFDSSTDEIKMKLYPNPTSGSLTIENIMEGAAVEIYNSLGQLVYNSAILTGRNQYDFSYLNAGIYIVHLKDINNETISISQLMIQK